MEAKINIAAILKDKSQGTKLYSPIFGNLRYDDLVPDLGEFTVVTSDNTSAKHSFRSDSRYNRHGEPLMLLPSKEMRDWEKFAWKKGDVLVNSNRDVHIIFEGFENDTYTRFKGKHYLWKEGDQEDYNKEETKMLTSVFVKVNDDAVKCYINTIEERLGGKLNRETLEIEPAQPEFKDGDVLFVRCKDEGFIEIFKYSKKNGDLYDHASLTTRTQALDISGKYKIRKDEIVEIRLATEEEKKLFFSALAKKNKAWNAEKKQIVDSKQKVELKPFDRVLVRDYDNEVWRANLFSNYTSDGSYGCVCGAYNQCIPYNEKTAKLIGTTNNVEG